ncbi:MAG: TonB-dependent receptor domain-containing protein, partial [Bryobacteraceae bacterium]
LRQKSLQARNPFSFQVDPTTGALTPIKQAYTRTQAGATLGGPIRKDKSFFFLSYETTRRQETGFNSIGENNFGLTTASVPCFPFPITMTSSQFTFYNAAMSAPGACGSAALTGAALITAASSNVALNADMNKNANGTVVPIASTLGIPSAFGSQFFPPAFAGVLAPLPTPSFVGMNSLRGNYPATEGTSFWSARLDQNWNSRNTTFLRVNISPSTITGIQVNGQNQVSGTNAYSRTSNQQTRDFALVAEHSTAISSSLFNQARFQYARRGLHYGYSQGPGGSNVAVDILGFASFGREPFSTEDRIERRLEWSDDLSWTKGRHTLKFGVDANLIQLRSNTNQIFELDFGGIYRFSALTASQTGLPTALSAVQAYGLGVPGSYLQGVGNSGRTFDNKVFAGYAQDSWKLTPRLTLNFGVRYDVELTPLFTPVTSINAAAEKALGVVEGIPRDYNNVGPRAAIAWDPWGDG